MYIPIVFATDNNYAIPTGIAITSLILNKNKETCYDIYILSDNVSEENIALLEELKSDTVKINVIKLDSSNLKQYDDGQTYLSVAAFLRFEIPELLPQYDKVLYLDDDILVQKDLSSFYNLDVENYYTAAVRDMPGEVNFNFPQRVNTTKYFNSGVLLLNTKKIRKDFEKQVFYDSLKLLPDLKLKDQDALNLVFKENVLWLDARYNLMMYNFLMLRYTVEMVNNFFEINYNTFEELQEDAYIIHLTNAQKPWQYKYVFMSNEWAEYHAKSPFKNIPIRYLDLDSFEAWAAENFVF